MIKRISPYEGILHEVVEHNGVLYIGGIVSEGAQHETRQPLRHVGGHSFNLEGLRRATGRSR